jgi:small subunit ribosomal protein S3
VIGRRGRNIDRIVEDLKREFGLDNVALDVREVEVPELDAQVMAREIARALERGINYRRVANVMLRRIMEHAAGCMIKISGKLTGEIARTEKFYAGYLKHAGEYAESVVRTGKATAVLKPGVIGIEVKIMPELPKELKIEKEKEEEGAEHGDTAQERVEENVGSGVEKEAE